MTRTHPHPACQEEELLLRDCQVNHGRSSGPGGQHRNKVQTEITLTHEPTGIIAQAGERRSQIENKHVAVFRLRLLLAVHHRCSPPALGGQELLHGQEGSDLWRSRIRGGTVACNPEHRDYPAILAEAMDFLAESGFDHKRAALRLDITPSQLLKLVKDHPPAWVLLNKERLKLGLHPLK